MLRSLLSSRLFIFCVIFCVVFVAGSLLYSSYHRRQTDELFGNKQRVAGASFTTDTQTAGERDAEKNDHAAPPHENGLETNEVSTAETGLPPSPSEPVVSDEKPSQMDAESTLEETTEGAATPVRVSPFGLGIFPEIPADFPEPDVWKVTERPPDDPSGKTLELLIRVRLKLWEQGTETIGAAWEHSTGLIYPSIPNVVYVEWAYVDEPDGTQTRYASYVGGIAGGEAEPYLDRGEDPPGITVIPFEEGGIDPYTFLDFRYE